MTNVINFNQRVEENTEEQVFPIHDIEGYMEQVLYMYDEEATGLCGTLSVLDHFELASITSIEKEIEEQLLEIENGESEKYYPWNDGGTIVCKEGAFIWDSVVSEYVWIGNVRRTVRHQTIRLKKEAVLDFGHDEIRLVKGDEFLIKGQYFSYEDDRKAVIMLVVKRQGKAPIVLPYDQELVSLQYEDLAVIG